jgi:sugar fermentation stimulation protein A
VTFDPPLIPCHFRRRWKRFLAEVEGPGGDLLTVHLPNSGSMATCLGEGRPALISDSGNPARQLRHTLEMISDEAGWIVVNTLRANTMAREVLEAGRVPGFDGAWSWRPEARRGGSRLDFHGRRGEAEAWVEVKSVTLRLEDGWAGFPDSVTTRGRKHLEDLRGIVEEGGRALLLLMVQRAGLRGFRPAAHIDPAWAEGLRRAVAAGVEIQALQVQGDERGLHPGELMPVALA